VKDAFLRGLARARDRLARGERLPPIGWATEAKNAGAHLKQPAAPTRGCRPACANGDARTSTESVDSPEPSLASSPVRPRSAAPSCESFRHHEKRCAELYRSSREELSRRTPVTSTPSSPPTTTNSDAAAERHDVLTEASADAPPTAHAVAAEAAEAAEATVMRPHRRVGELVDKLNAAAAATGGTQCPPGGDAPSASTAPRQQESPQRLDAFGAACCGLGAVTEASNPPVGKRSAAGGLNAPLPGSCRGGGAASGAVSERTPGATKLPGPPQGSATQRADTRGASAGSTFEPTRSEAPPAPRSLPAPPLQQFREHKQAEQQRWDSGYEA